MACRVCQAFDVDAAEVEAAYKRLQRALHPDRFAASGDAGVTAAAEGAAAAANAAVAALRDPLLRAEAASHTARIFCTLATTCWRTVGGVLRGA